MVLAPRLDEGTAEASAMISSWSWPPPSASTLGGLSRGGLGSGPSARAGEEGAEGVASADAAVPAGGVGAAGEAPGMARGALQNV